MATRQPTIKKRYDSQMARDIIVQWSGMLNGDDGAWFGSPGMVLRAYSASGTFGVGGNIAFKVSCQDVPGVGGGALGSGTQADESILTGAGTVTTVGTVTAGQYTASTSYRPTVTAGDGTTNLVITMYFIAD